MATRGCPYECTFCSNPQMWGRKYELRTPEDFVDELEYFKNKYDIKNFDLYDLTAIIVKKWIIAMCREVLRRDLNITFQLPSGTRSEVIDAEVAEWLFKAGCKNISYAPESGSEKVLKEVKKRVRLEKMLKSIKAANRAGLNIKLNMVLGFPDDTHLDIWRSFIFLIKASWCGAYDAAPAVFSPYPGSALFERLCQEGEISLDTDAYLYEIIEIYDPMPPKIYCKNISSAAMRFYILAFIAIFYGSNFIFRPARFVRMVYNLMRHRHESRLEHILYNNLLKHISVLPNMILTGIRRPRSYSG
ncbi:MAG: radical SAM protein [Bacteroidetes bacterium]|nr:radical SAM protein [Bacteroidota bacterium]